MMGITTLKKEAWQKLRNNWRFLVVLTWPLIAWQIFTLLLSYGDSIQEGVTVVKPSSVLFALSRTLWAGLIEAIIIGVISLGVMWTMVEWSRDKMEFKQTGLLSFRFFKRETVIDSVVLMAIRFLYTLLWSCLLVVPGIIKNISYSQAEFIYAEDVKRGVAIESINEYIIRSRVLMDGHKWEYFLLQITFIPWWILVALTSGLATFWVIPYYELTMTNFYLGLKKAQADDLDTKDDSTSEVIEDDK